MRPAFCKETFSVTSLISGFRSGKGCSAPVQGNVGAGLSFLMAAILIFTMSCSREAQDSTVLNVAAASVMKFAMDDIAEQFYGEYPQWRIRTSYGSSGNLFSQLVNRAPFDIYFSADMRYPEMLVERGIADREALFHYADGGLAVWALHDAPVNVGELGIESLRHPSATRISLANPRHAPYGAAAEEALKYFHIYEDVRGRLIYGDNVVQAAQFIESGSASVGIIALAVARAPVLMEKGTYWEIPQDSFPRLQQGGVILPWAGNKEAAEAFRDFVLGEKGRAILRRYGFHIPERSSESAEILQLSMAIAGARLSSMWVYGPSCVFQEA